MRLLITSLAILWVGVLTVAAASENGPWSVSSPSGSLSLVVEMKEPSGAGSAATGLSCRVLGDNGEVLPSAPLGITLERLGQFTENLRFVQQSAGIIDERYAMPVGKKSQCINHANELTLDFLNDTNAKISLILRAYDDGVAYRYRIHGDGHRYRVERSFQFPHPSRFAGLVRTLHPTALRVVLRRPCQTGRHRL